MKVCQNQFDARPMKLRANAAVLANTPANTDISKTGLVEFDFFEDNDMQANFDSVNDPNIDSIERILD